MNHTGVPKHGIHLGHCCSQLLCQALQMIKGKQRCKKRDANKIIAGHNFRSWKRICILCMYTIVYIYTIYRRITKKGNLAKQSCHTGLRVLLKRVSHMFFNVAHAISQGGMTGLHGSTINIKVFENWNWKEGIEENAFCHIGSFYMQIKDYIMLRSCALSGWTTSGWEYTTKNSHKADKKIIWSS